MLASRPQATLLLLLLRFCCGRHCLGYGLAMAEMKAFLALLARHYTFTAENNTEWVRGVGMVPQNGLPLVVSRMA